MWGLFVVYFNYLLPTVYPVFIVSKLLIRSGDGLCCVGGEQSFLNFYFRDWAKSDISKHLPFVYNLVSRAFYSYAPAIRQ